MSQIVQHRYSPTTRNEPELPNDLEQRMKIELDDGKGSSDIKIASGADDSKREKPIAVYFKQPSKKQAYESTHPLLALNDKPRVSMS